MRKSLPISMANFGFCLSPFGLCCITFSDNGIYAISFIDSEETAKADLEYRFPSVDFEQDDDTANKLGQQIFNHHQTPELHPIGTDFQLSVWHALQQIPAGKTTTYAQIAQAIGRPKAVRAVGTAIGANPIAYLIPCHRVIRTDGTLGGFRWGLECKKAMLEYEKQK